MEEFTVCFFDHTRKRKHITDVHLFLMYTEIIIFWRRKFSAFKKEFATSLKNMQCVCVCCDTYTQTAFVVVLCSFTCFSHRGEFTAETRQSLNANQRASDDKQLVKGHNTQKKKNENSSLLHHKCTCEPFKCTRRVFLYL